MCTHLLEIANGQRMSKQKMKNKKLKLKQKKYTHLGPIRMAECSPKCKQNKHGQMKKKKRKKTKPTISTAKRQFKLLNNDNGKQKFNFHSK